MDIHTTLYDTWQPGTTASAEATLFQTPQGGDATHTQSFTNMRGSGSLPSEEQFVINRLHLMMDENVTDVDFDTMLYGAFLEIRLKDKIVWQAPAGLCYSASAKGGHFAQAAAADAEFIGPVGNGFTFSLPLIIKGGERFSVRAVQGAAFAAAIDFKVILEGILTLPD